MRVPELELELEFEFNATAELELELVNSRVALLWLRLLQLGVSLVSGEDHGTHRKCE